MATSSPTLFSPPSLSHLFTFLLCLSFTHLTPCQSSSSSTVSFVYGGCSQLKYSPDDAAYAANLHSLLTALLNSATYSSYNHFTVVGSSPSAAVHGLYQCRGDLPMPECAACVSHSASRLAGLCPGTCGGVVQLQGCFLKYDNESFFGVEDKDLLFKKCGPPPAGLAPEVMAARDAVLDGLVRGPGLYRVGGSREVQGMAQCVGDLSTGQCQDCVGEAVKQVKMACGNGAPGDVYLGKCYVRYTLGGGRSYFNSNNGYIKNMGVKTFALIIGLLAAIAILIIFLTFLCRTFAGSSK
ncbi:hypothetical protein Cgig2_016639 [Carnegiea gigantea]|uniref:Gnk2-homologous domain-containing protein n=1 Tax=Carnegiea gigantea TaxID=171969 RepID=A0A9Q1L042_9CARY|nr:hypothetical protein Cgig2_016639 [Carnegiea gigantea]